MPRLLMVAILATTVIGIGVAFADDNNLTPEGLFLNTYDSNHQPALNCYVAAYVYDITSANDTASLYIIGNTEETRLPPNYNVCRFAREEAGLPRIVIPCNSRYRWRFYAFKMINGTTYYSNWSKEMQYSSPDHLFDTDNLYLTRTSPPNPIPPFYAQE